MLPSMCKKPRFGSGSLLQLTLHATCPTPNGASTSVQAMFAWSVKTRRAPSRHCRDAGVYGHTKMAITHMMRRTPSPRPPRFPGRYKPDVLRGSMIIRLPPRMIISTYTPPAPLCIIYIYIGFAYVDNDAVKNCR